MPWAASAVYLTDTTDARAVLLADPRLAHHIYAVDLHEVPHPPTIAHGWNGRVLAVRSPVRARDLVNVVDGFDWKDLDGALASQLLWARPHLGGASSRIAPPDGQMRWLEDLAARVGAPVVWYMAEAMASEPEAEIAWVLDWGGPNVVGGEELVREPTVYTRKDYRMVRLRAGGPDFGKREPLGAALVHLGLRLDGPWFTPHRPDFDWDAHRLLP